MMYFMPFLLVVIAAAATNLLLFLCHFALTKCTQLVNGPQCLSCRLALSIYRKTTSHNSYTKDTLCCSGGNEMSLWSLAIQSSASLFSALINALVDTNRDGPRRDMTCIFPSFQLAQQCSPVYMRHKCSLLMVVSSLPPAGQSSFLSEVQERSILQLWKCHQITARWAFARERRHASQQAFSKHVNKSSLSHMPALPRPILIPTE